MTKLFQEMNQPQKMQIPQNIRNMMQMVKTFKHPETMINSIIDKNPQLKSLIDASNGDYEKAFRDLAKEMNVDADEIIKMLN